MSESTIADLVASIYGRFGFHRFDRLVLTVINWVAESPFLTDDQIRELVGLDLLHIIAEPKCQDTHGTQAVLLVHGDDPMVKIGPCPVCGDAVQFNVYLQLNSDRIRVET